MYYVPTPPAAYESVRYITDVLTLGWLVRGLHLWGASFIVVAAGVHVMRVFLFGSYKAPRELTWISGLALLLLILGFSLSGYLLPWDQKAYWATTVSINITRSVLLLGEPIAALMRGGADLGALTLGRWYTVHVFLLPAVVALLVVAHIALIRRHGISGPIQPKEGPSFPFFPWHAIKDTILTAAVFATLLTVAATVPVPLEEIADAADTRYDPRPEWYFFALFQLLKYAPGRLEPIATVVFPVLVIGFLAALPFLDHGSDRRPFGRSRRIFTVIMLLFVGGILNLTILGMLDMPARYDPNDWGPQALAGYEFLKSEESTCGGCHVAGGSAEELTEIQPIHDEAWEIAHMMDPVAIAPLERDPDELARESLVRPLQARAVTAYLRRIRAGATPPPFLSEGD